MNPIIVPLDEMYDHPGFVLAQNNGNGTVTLYFRYADIPAGSAALGLDVVSQYQLRIALIRNGFDPMTTPDLSGLNSRQRVNFLYRKSFGNDDNSVRIVLQAQGLSNAEIRQVFRDALKVEE